MDAGRRPPSAKGPARGIEQHAKGLVSREDAQLSWIHKGIIEHGYGYAFGDKVARTMTFSNAVCKMLAQVKRPLPLGLPLPLSYNHLLLRPTLALPLAKPVVGVAGRAPTPLLISSGEEP